MNDHQEPRREGVRSGAPGAEWFIAAIFAFSVVVLAAWQQGWWDGSRNTAGAPTASHRMTTGSGGSTQP